MVLVKVADVVKREDKLPEGRSVVHHIVVLYDETGQRAIPILTIGEDVIVDSSTIIRELRRRYA